MHFRPSSPDAIAEASGVVRRPEEDEPRVALAGDSLAGSATAGISKEEQKFELKSKAALQSRVSRSVSYESLAWRRSECFCAWAALLRTSGQVVESRSQVMNDERSALGEISCPKCRSEAPRGGA